MHGQVRFEVPLFHIYSSGNLFGIFDKLTRIFNENGPEAAIAFIFLLIVSFISRKILSKITDQGVDSLYVYINHLIIEPLSVYLREYIVEQGPGYRLLRTIIKISELKQLSEAKELLDEIGFDLLDEEMINSNEVDPTNCWQRPFRFSEIAEGYAIDRQYSTENQRQSCVTDLLDRLDNGNSSVVLGPPGSGKTTLLKIVAYAWFKRKNTGPVLYRKSGLTEFYRRSDLEKATDRLKLDGKVLVVIENIADANSIRLQEVISSQSSENQIVFLCDARSSDWSNFDEVIREQKTFNYESDLWSTIINLWSSGDLLNPYHLPPADSTEVMRFVQNFERITSKKIVESAEQLYDEIKSAPAGEILLLTYLLSVYQIDVERPEGAVRKTAIDIQIGNIYQKLYSEDRYFGPRLSVFVCILNISNLPIEESTLRNLGKSDRDSSTLNSLLKICDGTIFFRNNARIQGQHEIWSLRYLIHGLEREGESLMNSIFEYCINEYIQWAEDNNISSDKLENRILRIFKNGEREPSLAPILGDSRTSSVSFDDFSDSMIAEISYLRAKAYYSNRDFERANDEYLYLAEFAENPFEEDFRDRIIAISLNGLGSIAQAREKYSEANQYYQESLKLAKKSNDRIGEIRALLNISSLNINSVDEREKMIQRCLNLSTSEDDQYFQALSLLHLSEIEEMRLLEERSQESLQVAIDKAEKALQLGAEIGVRDLEIDIRSQLANLYEYDGQLDKSYNFIRWVVQSNKQLSARWDEAHALRDLGTFVYEHKDKSEGLKYKEQALSLAETLEDKELIAQIHHDFAHTEQMNGYLDESIADYREALKNYSDKSDEFLVAAAANNLGILLNSRHKHEEAATQLLTAFNIYEKENSGLIVYVISELVNSHRLMKDKEMAKRWSNIGISYATDHEKYVKINEFRLQDLMIDYSN